MKKFRNCIVALIILLSVPALSMFGAEEEQKPDPPIIKKSVSPIVAQAGDIVHYTIVVRNLNDVWVGEHIVRDVFPANKIMPYIYTLTVMRGGIQLTGGHMVDDCFLLYDYCLTGGYIDLLFYGLPPLSETIITFYSRVLPGVTFDTEIINEVTIWFALWAPGPWNPETGRYDPGHRNLGEYPVGSCYAVVNLSYEDGNDNRNDTGNDDTGGLPPWQPPIGGGVPPNRPTVRLPYTPSDLAPYTPSDPLPSEPLLLPPLPPPLDMEDTQLQPYEPYDYTPAEYYDDKPPIPRAADTINPQTGDDFTITRLVVSVIGIILSLSIVFFLLLKLRRNEKVV